MDSSQQTAKWALALGACAAPGWAVAAPAASLTSTLVQLPLMLALAIGAHVLLGRIAKWLAGAISPLATGEEEAVRYQRDVYGSVEREVLEVVGVVLAGGVLLWLGSTFAPSWLINFGVVLVLAAVVLDLLRWERASASANFVWFQRGLTRKVHQVAMERARRVSAGRRHARLHASPRSEQPHVPGAPAPERQSHGSLPRTDAHRLLDDVETLANHVRARQQMLGEHDKLNRAGRDSGVTTQAPGRVLTDEEREMRRELKRLRSQALAPDVPAAVKQATPAVADPTRDD